MEKVVTLERQVLEQFEACGGALAIATATARFSSTTGDG